MEEVATRLVFGRLVYLSGNENDTYLRSLIENPGLPEYTIINLVSSVCSDNSHMLDVGANIGYISIVMSLIAPKGKIYSFEPSPKIFAYLKKNIKNNELKNISAYKVGLSDKNYRTTISYTDNNLSSAFISKKISMKNMSRMVVEDIKLESLDRVYKKLGMSKCDLLKVDIEGHEPSFLLGAKNFIAKFKPTTIIEVNHWCLNVFSRIPLPDFIESTYDYFPYIFAFDDGQYLDLSNPESRFHFYYKNTVDNKFQNLFCGFDKKQLMDKLNKAFDNRVKFLNDKIAELTAQNMELTQRCNRLESSKSHRVAKKINTILNR